MRHSQLSVVFSCFPTVEWQIVNRFTFLLLTPKGFAREFFKINSLMSLETDITLQCLTGLSSSRVGNFKKPYKDTLPLLIIPYSNTWGISSETPYLDTIKHSN